MIRFPSALGRILLVVPASILALLAAGAVLAEVQAGYYAGASFFEYRVWHLDDLPAWFVAVMLQLAINGALVFRWAAVHASFHTPTYGWGGDYQLYVPLPTMKVIGVNLLSIPALLLVFTLVRARGW